MEIRDVCILIKSAAVRCKDGNAKESARLLRKAVRLCEAQPLVSEKLLGSHINLTQEAIECLQGALLKLELLQIGGISVIEPVMQDLLLASEYIVGISESGGVSSTDREFAAEITNQICRMTLEMFDDGPPTKHR